MPEQLLARGQQRPAGERIAGRFKDLKQKVSAVKTANWAAQMRYRAEQRRRDLTKKPESAEYERSDVCAVSAASVIVENVVAFEIAAALVDKFGGDSLQEMKARWDLFFEMAKQR